MDAPFTQTLTARPFTITNVLQYEASSLLSQSSPIRDPPKCPSGSRLELTKMGKHGEGPAHCLLRKWPPENTPQKWGIQNEQVLLRSWLTLLANDPWGKFLFNTG